MVRARKKLRVVRKTKTTKKSTSKTKSSGRKAKKTVSIAARLKTTKSKVSRAVSSLTKTVSKKISLAEAKARKTIKTATTKTATTKTRKTPQAAGVVNPISVVKAVSKTSAAKKVTRTLAKNAPAITGAVLAATSTGGKSTTRSLLDLGVAGPGIISYKDLTPNYYGGVTKSWVTNGVTFQRNENGTITVQKKDGTLKTYRPYKPTVFGKKTDAAKFTRLAKKYRKQYQELNKLFGKRTVRK